MNAETLIRNEVHLNLSYLVATLAEGTGFLLESRRGNYPLSDLAYQAAELASPVLDYEEAAREAGWRIAKELEVNAGHAGEEPSIADPRDACGWESLCSEFDIDPYEREVFEFWAVSDHLADDLIAVGEKVDKDFAGLCVWARTTTGQGIANDSCIQDVLRLMARRAVELTGYTPEAAP